MEEFEKFEHKGFTVKLVPDECEDNPREWDNLGTMVCWHRHYNLGDESPRESVDSWLESQLGDVGDKSTEEMLAMFMKDKLLIPIMAYEHGGITIRAYDYGNFPDQQWDCGQLGFIYVTHDKIKKEYSISRLTKKALASARKCLENEIEVYNDYLTGYVCGYIVEDSEGNIMDSCYGFFGEEGTKQARQEGIDSAEYHAKEKEKEEEHMNRRLVLAAAGHC